MEREKIEAWADALLDEHRTAPKTADRPTAARRPTEQDRMAALLAEAGVTPATPDLLTHQRRTETALDPDAWVGKAQTLGMVLVALLVLSLLMAIAIS